MSTLSFLGATGTVTGSKYLLEHNGCRLMVDCGLFQGLKELRERNWAPPPIEPGDLDLVALTHAHLDHSGYLPLMCSKGFEGKVLGTHATTDLCGILLPDAGHIQEEDARFANKHRFSKHRPALPLYTEEIARRSLGHLRPFPFDRAIEVHDGISLRFYPAGHILGAAFIEVRLRRNGGGETVVVFGGDLGRPDRPILPDPSPLPACDHLLLESTYGNRDHPTADVKDRLVQIVRETVSRGGTLLIPAFAVGRTQALLYILRELQNEDRLPHDVPIHVDSPMAIHTIRVFMQHHEAHDLEMRARVANGEDPLGLRDVHLDSTVEESKALNNLAYPAIIISASGMATGGRILHHLAYRLPDHRTTVLFGGYQAVGTRGRALQDGAEEIKIHGRMVRVRARIETLDGLSAHADRGQLLEWLGTAPRPPKHVHLVHGEPPALEALRGLIRERTGIEPHVPVYREKVRL
jgi:metallo-beta-lactamase family protein